MRNTIGLLVCFIFVSIFAAPVFSGQVDVPPFCSANRGWYKYQFAGDAWKTDYKNMNCGPTSYAMIVHYATGMIFQTEKDSHKTCKPEIKKEILDKWPDLKTEARWRGCDDQYNFNGPSNGWEPDYMDGTLDSQVQSALANEGITSHALTGIDVYIEKSRENEIDLSLIKDVVDDDKPVIVHVDACKYKEEPCFSSHWTIIYGYDDKTETFSVNDPGYQWETSVTYTELKNAMKNAFGGNDEVLIIIDTTSLGIGYFSKGSSDWDNQMSQKFVDAYKQNGRYNKIGSPSDEPGWEKYVHPYSFELNNGSTSLVYVQDFNHPEKGKKTICYQPGLGQAYLLQGCFGYLWWENNNMLGAPTSDEVRDKTLFTANWGIDDFEVMQTFEYGSMFWDCETGMVRMFNDYGSCELNRKGSVIAFCEPDETCTCQMSARQVMVLEEPLSDSDLPNCEDLSEETKKPSMSSTSDGFVFPVLAASQTDPTKNTIDPLTQGWTGHGVGWTDCDLIGHLGQDYYLSTGCSGTEGHSVFAVSNGTVVQVINNPDT